MLSSDVLRNDFLKLSHPPTLDQITRGQRLAYGSQIIFVDRWYGEPNHSPNSW
jgi:hypothetical protein